MSYRNLTHRIGYRLSVHATRLLTTLFFRVRYSGRKNFPATGGGLICSNHQSFLDPVLVGQACERPMNYLARETLFHVPGFKQLIEFYEAIPIDRDGMGLDGIKETLKRLKRGEFVLIFPEGTRSPDGNVLPLKSGICALARRGRVPLIPVGLDGAHLAWPKGQKFPSCATIHIDIGEPIWPNEFVGRDDEQLVAELQKRIEACHARARESRLRAVNNNLFRIGKNGLAEDSLGEWTSRWRTFLEKRRSRNPHVDDSRESIYEDR